MATRTFKLKGTSDGTFTVTFNGSQVHSGSAHSDDDVLCEFTADTTVNGSIPVTVTVNTGDETIVKGLEANYAVYSGQTYTDDNNVLQTYTADEVTSIFEAMQFGSKNAVTDIELNDVAWEDDDTGFQGVIWRSITNGDVLTCNMVVDAIASA